MMKSWAGYDSAERGTHANQESGIISTSHCWTDGRDFRMKSTEDKREGERLFFCNQLSGL